MTTRTAMKTLPHYLALTLLASALQNLHAAESSIADTLLPATVVTATRKEAQISSLPPSVSAVTQEQLQQQFIADYSDLSKGEPDLSISRHPRYGLSSVNIRGLEGNRVLMMVDGIRLADSFAFGPYQNNGRDTVDFASLQSIEIVRGPASSLYGSDALGGVVGLRTLEPAELLKGRGPFTAQLGMDYDSSDASVGARASLAGMAGEDSFWLLQLAGREGSELDNRGEYDSKNNLCTTPNPQDISSRSALVKFRTLLDGGHTLGLTADYFRRNTDTELYSDLGDPMLPTVRSSRAEDQTERWRVSGEYDFAAQNASSWLDSASVRLYAQQQDTAQTTLQRRTTASNWSRVSEYSQDLLGMNAQAGKRWQTGLFEQNVLAGLELSRTDLTQYRTGTPLNSTLEVRDVPLTTTTQWGLFIQDEMALAGTGLTLTPALRYDNYDLQPNNDSAFLKQGGKSVSLSDGKLSPKLVLSWKASDTASFFAQYSQGFRAPSPMELNGSYVSPMGYAAVANPDLKPETSAGFEVGTRLGSEQLGLSLSAFDNHYKNFIEQVTLICPANPACLPRTSLIYQSQNVANVEIYGAELRAHWSLIAGWRTWANLAWARGSNSDTGAALDSVAPLKGQWGLSYTDNNWGGALLLSAAASHERVSQQTYFKTPGYGVLDLTTWWEPRKDWRVNAGIFNLANKKYWLASDVVGVSSSSKVLDRYSQPGINARVSLNWKY
ncbi:TonB-dependent hemoglobin/transferrin/lactoferrin family receptor [Chitinibacter fontanus]|uniref:TonB-dependent hemoglobin/transferrin/lactoferrin family receptor n=1 Tax=Chitinibacter fontanus TaxID=1737446 RepID=A0A7D5VBN6_9NEIS|nr:TonB-dependent hemoglobin/transferrin/lactoferrin family receptor [Chitinibacter fontanus]QLI82592.1 TonB-dependent hemoglobin/transferrin/lactoferrin family receptor [Chitinibacter fontanus]